MLAPESQDADFFKMMHRSPPPVLTLEPDDDDERRQRSRRSYPTVQSIAPYVNNRLPQQVDFWQVQCQDLSTTGIAFFASSPPNYDRLVVALASPFEVIYLTAAVAHYKSVGTKGQAPSYLIGCRFLGRVHLEK